MDFQIRPAVQSDVAYLAESLIAIARSVREQTGSAYNGKLPHLVTPGEFQYALGFLAQADSRFARIAEKDGNRIGCVLAEIIPSAVPSLNPDKTGSIAACWVEPDYRKQGVGRALAAQAETWFRAQGVRFAELSYGADSETAGAAWAAQGYAPFRIFAVKDLSL